MAVTRREFVTTLGMMAAAMGLSQTDLARVTQAFGHGSPKHVATTAWDGDWTDKPKVIWVHGAECTGCSTSVLGLYEDARAVAVPDVASLGIDVNTAQALALVGGATVPQLLDPDVGAVNFLQTKVPGGASAHPSGDRTLELNTKLNVDGSAYAVNIQDVLIDFLDLQYHETVMAMGGDGAYAYLESEMGHNNGSPFVLVVEGAIQRYENGGYWDKHGTVTTGTYGETSERFADAPWCSIAKDGTASGVHEMSFDRVVEKLATNAQCVAIVAVGQCAAFGGYPACIGPDLVSRGSGTKSQTQAQGVYDFLISRGLYGGGSTSAPAPDSAAGKVVNVPGCPVNPWWFTLTVVAWLVDAVTATDTANGKLDILNGELQIVGGVDDQRRLLAVYGNLLHGRFCPRYPKYADRIFASQPGDDGCLKNIGCKGLSTMSSCGRHGWNAQQPGNDINTDFEALAYESSNGTKSGGSCMTAGAPCMGCTEKGYPDAFTPFVVR
jgi:Ni,Fe-hydrogenase I small subunit